jgi:hypothetical protein
LWKYTISSIWTDEGIYMETYRINQNVKLVNVKASYLMFSNIKMLQLIGRWRRHIFIYFCFALLSSREINCFQYLWTWIYRVIYMVMCPTQNYRCSAAFGESSQSIFSFGPVLILHFKQSLDMLDVWLQGKFPLTKGAPKKMGSLSFCQLSYTAWYCLRTFFIITFVKSVES